MDYSPPGSSVHGILQARILEWVAISFSRGSSWPRVRTQVSRIAGRRFNLWAKPTGLASPVAQMVKCLPTMQETQLQSLGREISWRRKWQPTPVFLPGKSHRWRRLVSCSPWGRKESDMTEWLHFTSLLHTPMNELGISKWSNSGRRDRRNIGRGL